MLPLWDLLLLHWLQCTVMCCTSCSLHGWYHRWYFRNWLDSAIKRIYENVGTSCNDVRMHLHRCFGIAILQPSFTSRWRPLFIGLVGWSLPLWIRNVHEHPTDDRNR